MSPVDPWHRERFYRWCERNADGVVVAICLIALAVIVHIRDLWS